jgi:hypothetical protein
MRSDSAPASPSDGPVAAGVRRPDEVTHRSACPVLRTVQAQTERGQAAGVWMDGQGTDTSGAASERASSDGTPSRRSSRQGLYRMY